MKINDYQIFSQLNTDYKYACEKYSEKNVYGIFAFGKVNTPEGISSIEDLTTEIIIFPTFEQVCLNVSPIKTCADGGRVIIKDIRCIYDDLAVAGNTLLDEALDTDYRIVNMQYEKLFEMYMFNNRTNFNGISLGLQEPINELKHSVVEILRTVFNENSTSIKFIKELTDAEKLGLSAILEKLENGCGVVSIAKLCKDKDISRYVFDNLLRKLKEYKLAAVVPWGPHGMNIQITDYRLLNF